ncbi:MAG TPA: carboxypeptidase-like regulatory domain-containing protein [Ohtaekwangia sp.]
MVRLVWIIAVVFLTVQGAFAQSITVKGVITDETGERLPLAHLLILPDSVNASTNNSGHFSLHISPGKKTIHVTYVGFENYQRIFIARKDTTISIRLDASTSELREVVVTSGRNVQQDVFESNQTSTQVLTQETITALPVLGGEADVIKVLQLLPGTVRGVEGSSDLFVRGGAADQNLVLLDDVPIYNSSHLFGFLSVFNPDILDKVESINGGFPAEYGGRLSSVLNIRTIERIPERTHVSADIGVIASRIFIEQPIVKNKASFWISGRRTYIDQVVRTLGEELPYYFYDLNGKIIVTPTKRDRLSFTYYSGEDILDLFRDRNNDGSGLLTTFDSGNNSQSFTWNRSVASNFSTEVSLIHSEYQYKIRNAFEENSLMALSDIEDYGVRLNVRKDSLPGGATFTSGAEWIRHAVSPNVINTEGGFAQFIESSASSGQIANEIAIHAQYEWIPAKHLRVNAGIRGSMAIVENKNYINPEPRISARYALSKNRALKFSYSRMVQYMHRISNSAVSSPTDIWYPVTETISPQTSHQFALAWQRNIPRQNIFMSVEGYYKSMNNLIGYEEGTNLFLNNDFASKLIQGKGTAYGFEFLLRKDAGRFKGWISYTLSWSWRQFDEINDGKWFHSRYDRRHNGAIVMQYALSKRFAASIVWEFISGSRFTPVVGQYVIFAPTLTGVDLVPVYSGINTVKLADAHRLDAGIKFRSRTDKRFQWEWFAGVYNAYNRANPVGITIDQAADGSLRYQQPGLFGLIPFISYGFKF